jgi:hypothetical protein
MLKTFLNQDAKSPLLKQVSSGLRYAKRRKLMSRAMGSNR